MKIILLLIFLLFSISVFAEEDNAVSRIVSLGPTTTKQLFLLGVGDRIVGNTIYCNQPEAAKSITKIGNTVNINVEKIVALKPDIVFATGLTNNNQLEKLRKLGIKEIVTLYPPESYDDICSQLLRIGKVVDREKVAQKLVAESKSRVDIIKKETAKLPKVRVFVQIGANPLFTVTGSTFINDIITFAGGLNVTKNDSNGIYSMEKVLEKKPDVIIVSLMGDQGNKEVNTWTKFTSIPAVKNKRVYSINSYELCSPNAVSFPHVLEKVVQMLHPKKIMRE